MDAPLQLLAKVVQGHGVASGRAADSPYPQGSIAMQMPFFKALGLDLTDCWSGTLNLSIAPHSWSLLRADYCFEHLAWTALHPPETFSFLRLQLRWQDRLVAAWLYHPHPETKAAHHQSGSVMEIIAPRMEGLGYGDTVTILLPAHALLIH